METREKYYEVYVEDVLAFTYNKLEHAMQDAENRIKKDETLNVQIFVVKLSEEEVWSHDGKC
jgi:hypothetical protein